MAMADLLPLTYISILFMKRTLSKNVNSRKTPCFPTEAKDGSLKQEYFIFFCE